jgi:hypothetical protein
MKDWLKQHGVEVEATDVWTGSILEPREGARGMKLYRLTVSVEDYLVFVTRPQDLCLHSWLTEADFRQESDVFQKNGRRSEPPAYPLGYAAPGVGQYLWMPVLQAPVLAHKLRNMTNNEEREDCSEILWFLEDTAATLIQATCRGWQHRRLQCVVRV